MTTSIRCDSCGVEFILADGEEPPVPCWACNDAAGEFTTILRMDPEDVLDPEEDVDVARMADEAPMWAQPKTCAEIEELRQAQRARKADQAQDIVAGCCDVFYD